MTERQEHQLPKALNRYLASLAKKYQRDDNDVPLRVIVNAQPRVVEEWNYDNWDGGTWGHALYLPVPDALFHEIMDDVEAISQEIDRDLNTLCNVPNEHIAVVIIELADGPEIADWREQSGVLMDTGSMLVEATADDQERLWDDGGLRLFLSHKVAYKKETAALKDELLRYGVACFVAHADIEPTKEWQDEIERALSTMHLMVPLLTEEFNESKWTDQEVGVAIGRGVPVVPIRLGKDPYGFIGKYQAMQGMGKDTKEIAKELFALLLKNPKTTELAKDAFVGAVEGAVNWDHANVLAKLLPSIDTLTEQQVVRLVKAYNENSEVSGGYGFNGRNTGYYGPGLPAHLKRITGDDYTRNERNKIVIEGEIVSQSGEASAPWDRDDVPF